MADNELNIGETTESAIEQPRQPEAWVLRMSHAPNLVQQALKGDFIAIGFSEAVGLLEPHQTWSSFGR